MVDTKDYLQWLAKAENDLKAAKLILAGEQLYDISAFHCQQCVEKALKAYVLYHEGIIMETHSLPRLNQRCAKHDHTFLSFADSLHILNSFYIETRYPAVDELIVTRANAESAVDVANRVLEYVKSSLNA